MVINGEKVSCFCGLYEISNSHSPISLALTIQSYLNGHRFGPLTALVGISTLQIFSA